MVRTQVQFTDEQYHALREFSRARDESIASLVRRAVDQLLLTRKPDRSALHRQASVVVGKYRAKHPDIAVEHDRYLDESFGAGS
jgi:hypothetical protein